MKKIRNNYFILLICINTTINSGDFLKQFVKTDTPQKFFIGVIEEKQKLLNELISEQKELEPSNQLFTEKIAHNIAEIKTLSTNIEHILKQKPDDDLLIKEQSILNESEQILKDIQRTHDDNISLPAENITQFKIFLEDPYFESFKKKNKLQERLYYSFDDIQSLHDHILDYEQRVNQLTDQEKSIRIEKESRKRAIAALQEEAEKRQQDVKIFTDVIANNSGFSANIDQEKELIKLEDHLYKYKKQLADLRFKAIGYQLNSIEFQLFIAKSHLDLFKKQLRTVKMAIHVSEADITLAEEDLTKEQKIYFSHKDALRHEREKVVTAQKSKEKELSALSKQLSIPLGSEVDEWSKKPKQTSDSYIGLVHINALNGEALLYAREKDLLDGKIALEEEKFNYKKVRTEAKKTYHKISTRGFLTEEEIAKERTEYETKKKDAEENSKLYNTKISAVANLLNQLKKTLDRANAFHEDAEKQRDIIFKNKNKEYAQFNEYLIRADKALKTQIDILGKLTGIYSGIIAELSSTIRLIDFISTELQASTIWYRPAYAITAEGVKNIISDTKAFFNDIRIYLAKFNSTVFAIHIRDGFSRPLDILFLVLKIVTFIGILFFIKRYKTNLVNTMLVRSEKWGILINMCGFIIGAIIMFISMFSYSIGLWIILCLLCGMIRIITFLFFFIFALFPIFSIYPTDS